MCNQEYAKENKIGIFAVCSCGAFFHNCKDDRIEAFNHITDRSSPNHEWKFYKGEKVKT